MGIEGTAVVGHYGGVGEEADAQTRRSGRAGAVRLQIETQEDGLARIEADRIEVNVCGRVQSAIDEAANGERLRGGRVVIRFDLGLAGHVLEPEVEVAGAHLARPSEARHAE